MLDEQTAWMLALQLVALLSIASAILLYLICKIRGTQDSELSELSPGAGKPVLITCCDNAIGLQMAIHLANRGFRVFAGLKDASLDTSNETVPAKVIRAWQKHRESVQGQGNIVPLHLEVTREDLLHESVDIIRAHLPAGEDGIWAVICTNGLAYRGPLSQQDISHWDTILKTNIIGVLRTVRTFQNLLKNANGRIVTIGVTDNMMGGGLVAYAASRFAIEGASRALREELAPFGIKVITINPVGILPELLFCQPKLVKKVGSEEVRVEINGCLEYQPQVLSSIAMEILDVAMTAREPKNKYKLEYKYKWTHQLCLTRHI